MKHSLSFLSLGIALILAGCREDMSKIQSLQDEIRAVEEKEFKSRQELTRLKNQVSSMEAERDKLKADKTKLESEVEAAKKGLETMKKQFEDYKSQYKISIRKRAPGMMLGDMTVDGRSYKNVKIREVQDDGIYIGHEGGLTNWKWAQLPEALRFTLAQIDPSPILEAKEEMSFQTHQAASAPEKKLTREDHQKLIAEHDSNVSEIETQLKEHNKEILDLKREMSMNQAARTQAMRKNLPVVDIELAINACQVKITQLESEVEFLEVKKRSLSQSDPRKKRFTP
jgi:peptidoglycan hydrolase CwlO-like protein